MPLRVKDWNEFSQNATGKGKTELCLTTYGRNKLPRVRSISLEVMDIQDASPMVQECEFQICKSLADAMRHKDYRPQHDIGSPLDYIASLIFPQVLHPLNWQAIIHKLKEKVGNTNRPLEKNKFGLKERISNPTFDIRRLRSRQMKMVE